MYWLSAPLSPCPSVSATPCPSPHASLRACVGGGSGGGRGAAGCTSASTTAACCRAVAAPALVGRAVSVCATLSPAFYASTMCRRIASVAAPFTRATAPAGGGFTGSPCAAVAQLGHF
eukprot:1755254-Pleurochrysis_carterae.AAC.1